MPSPPQFSGIAGGVWAVLSYCISDATGFAEVND
jgi:hypothetical protein